MVLLQFNQEHKTINVAIFKSIAEGRKLVQQIPGYQCDQDDFETFDPQGLPDYLELELNGNRLPLTRFMFTESGPVSIDWIDIVDFSQPNQGLVDGTTLVDAYVVDNQEVKDYIQQREQKFQWAKEYLESCGYEVERAHFGSEDGESILYRKDEEDWHYLFDMDPCFVDELPFEKEAFKKIIIEILGEE